MVDQLCRVLALSSLVIISACSQMTDEEWKAFVTESGLKEDKSLMIST